MRKQDVFSMFNLLRTFCSTIDFDSTAFRFEFYSVQSVSTEKSESILAAIAINISFTLIESFADVSKKRGFLKEKRLLMIRTTTSSICTFPSTYSTTRFFIKSHLLPTKKFLTLKSSHRPVLSKYFFALSNDL